MDNGYTAEMPVTLSCLVHQLGGNSSAARWTIRAFAHFGTGCCAAAAPYLMHRISELSAECDRYAVQVRHLLLRVTTPTRPGRSNGLG